MLVPRIHGTGGDWRLPAGIENEPEAGPPRRGAPGYEQLVTADENVVDEAGAGDRLQPAQRLRPQPVRVMFVLDAVPDVRQPAAIRTFGERGEPPGNVSGTKVDPSDDPRDLVGRVGDRQHLRCLRRDLNRLNKHGSLHVGGREPMPQFV